MSKMRLQLTWYNKDMALIPTEAGRYGYRWVSPADAMMNRIGDVCKHSRYQKKRIRRRTDERFLRKEIYFHVDIRYVHQSGHVFNAAQ